MKDTGSTSRFWKILTIIVVAVAVATAIYIMVNRLGLVDGLDFGAGAYYYADIPDFEKYMHDEAYRTSLPLWVFVVLFLAWGYLMWRLWLWIDRRR